MSFWSSFTGSAQKKDAQSAFTDANASLGQARERALAALSGGNSAAQSSLTAGYNTATGEIRGGADRARPILEQGFDRARNDLDTNYGRAETAITSNLDPWIASGRAAQNRYDIALGTGGTAADQANFWQNGFAGNQYRDDLANKQLQQQFNARGQSNSGRFGTAVSRASLERSTTDMNQYLDRLSRQGELGGQYAARAGTELAGIRTGLGTQLAGLEQNRGTALGGLEERTGARLGDLGYQYGSGQANLYQGQGNAIAGVETGYGESMANNRIALGNATAASRNVFTNNLLGVAGLAVRGFTPGPSSYGLGINGTPTLTPGTTPFGAMGSAISSGWGSVRNALSGPAAHQYPTGSQVGGYY